MTNQHRKLILAIGDVALMYLALTAALWLRGVPEPVSYWQGQFWGFSLMHLIWLLVLYIDGFYSLKRLRLGLAFLQGLIRFSAFAGLLGAAFFYIFNVFGITPKTVLLLHLLSFLPLFVLWRHLAGRIFLSRNLRRPVIILQAEDETGMLADELAADPFGPFRVVATCLLNQPGLLTLAKDLQAETVVVSEKAWPRLPPETYDLAMAGIRIVDSVTFNEEYQQRIRAEGQDLSWFLAGFPDIRKPEYELAKRSVEAIGALATGLVLLPVSILIAFGVRLSGPGPILFVQERIGRHGRPFRLVKFRSMTADAENDGPRWAEKGDLRVTGFGRFLRHTHLDEIPQLWNVLRGEMSLIGPRPEQPAFVEELKRQIPYYGLRHLVRPGLSGWAQINYPYGASIRDAAEKLTYDLWYVKHRSTAVDLKIALKTVAMLFRGEGR
ncbi:sugar transferase [Candidatus Uhrbacteria bacterium]|nr:sugar transferase [Candidatus Uhrbacteria bacterium]